MVTEEGGVGVGKRERGVGVCATVHCASVS